MFPLLRLRYVIEGDVDANQGRDTMLVTYEGT